MIYYTRFTAFMKILGKWVNFKENLSTMVGLPGCVLVKKYDWHLENLPRGRSHVHSVYNLINSFVLDRP